MNIAVRELSSTVFAPEWFIDWSFSVRANFFQICMCIMILFSAFATVYFKDLNHRFSASVQEYQIQKNALDAEWSQLVLEESALASQSRIEQIAINKLNMVVPTGKNVILVKNSEIQ